MRLLFNKKLIQIPNIVQPFSYTEKLTISSRNIKIPSFVIAFCSLIKIVFIVVIISLLYAKNYVTYKYTVLVCAS